MIKLNNNRNYTEKYFIVSASTTCHRITCLLFIEGGSRKFCIQEKKNSCPRHAKVQLHSRDKDERDFSVSGIHGKDHHQNLSSTRTCPVWSNSLRTITQLVTSRFTQNSVTKVH